MGVLVEVEGFQTAVRVIETVEFVCESQPTRAWLCVACNGRHGVLHPTIPHTCWHQRQLDVIMVFV